LQNAIYVRSDGVRVRCVAEEAAPDYLAELQSDYQALQNEQLPLVSQDAVLRDLQELGVDV
jgi:hypothetical protein